MKNIVKRDQKRRNLFFKNELKRVQYKSVIKNYKIPGETKEKCVFKLNKIPRNSSRVRVKNRCILTGRGKAVYSFCRLSRIRFRELCSQGLLLGVTKSSW
uniref:Small ribosomal subunit protein uS14m n=1 Tax=Trebouxia lynnae TaxID=1825957 RepID=A0A5J6DTQ4_9CHLO|nr:ribosomal protein S14 [Trebouxia lynnae]